MGRPFSVVELQAQGRDLPTPFILEGSLNPALDDGPLECLEVLRVLPGRRIVMRARVGSRQCALKLFVGDRAARYARRERAGLELLAASGVDTPGLIADLHLPGGEGILVDWLAGSRPVDEQDTLGLADVAAALARLHANGTIQRDAHLNNYLRGEGGMLYAIDGDGVRRPARLRRRQEIANLALLLAQLPPPDATRLPVVAEAYWRARWGSGPRPDELAALQRRVHAQRTGRMRRYLRKTLRDCSEFHGERKKGRFVVCARDAWTAQMAEFVDRPEDHLAAGTVLKAGNSATVMRLRIGETAYVVKRYNVKGFFHGLRRALRPTPRYRVAWLSGHRLLRLGIATPRPVALLEARQGLATVAYLVMEDLGAARDLAQAVVEEGCTAAVGRAVAGLFRGLRDAGLVHGDTKASNFLVRDASVYLIDLDAMRPGSQTRSRDVARFLANWAEAPEVRESFRGALQEAGVPL
jgi:tRNA A-37 threonylcarbamoyl transferase component Bud32